MQKVCEKDAKSNQCMQKVYKKYVERIQKGFKKDAKCIKKYAKSVQNGFNKYPQQCATK